MKQNDQSKKAARPAAKLKPKTDTTMSKHTNENDDYETLDYDYLRTRQSDDDYWEERQRRQRIAWQAEAHPERMRNNPDAKPCGHFTGRCSKCGSNDLWDDNLHYGCNSCGAFLA